MNTDLEEEIAFLRRLHEEHTSLEKWKLRESRKEDRREKALEAAYWLLEVVPWLLRMVPRLLGVTPRYQPPLHPFLPPDGLGFEEAWWYWEERKKEQQRQVCDKCVLNCEQRGLTESGVSHRDDCPLHDFGYVDSQGRIKTKMSFKKFAARYENKRWMRQAEKRDRRDRWEGGGRTPDHATAAHFGLINAYHREIADKNENGEPITDENGSPVINGIPYEDILAM